MKSGIVVALLLVGLAGLTGAHANLDSLRHQAHKGIPSAQLKLGELYEYGVGQPDHLVRALVWYDRAARSLPRAAVLAARTAREMTPQQRQQAMVLGKEEQRSP